MGAVRVTRATRVYFNHSVELLAEGQEVPEGEFADYLRSTGAPVEEVAAAEVVDTDGDGVPDGSAAQVLDWVGTDPDRAAQALAAEQARETPRKGVLSALEKQVPPTEPTA
jgi:hypothetical protein